MKHDSLVDMNHTILRLLVTLLVAGLIAWFFAGCAPVTGDRGHAQGALAAESSRARWTPEDEMDRAAERILNAYEALGEDDEARVPKSKRKLASAIRIATLMTACRVVLVASPREEVQASKPIAASMWAGIQRSMRARGLEAPSLDEEESTPEDGADDTDAAAEPEDPEVLDIRFAPFTP